MARDRAPAKISDNGCARIVAAGSCAGSIKIDHDEQGGQVSRHGSKTLRRSKSGSPWPVAATFRGPPVHVSGGVSVGAVEKLHCQNHAEGRVQPCERGPRIGTYWAASKYTAEDSHPIRTIKYKAIPQDI